MKKVILTTIVIFFAYMTYADKYAEVTVIQGGIVNKVDVYFDNGIGKPEKIKSSEDRKFTSPVAVVNHFKKKGWTIKDVKINSSMANTIRIYIITKKEH